MDDHDHEHNHITMTTTTTTTTRAQAPTLATAATASDLRAELKQWERAFAAAHGGRRAGREDIKMVPEIAKKYKTYDRLRRQDSAAAAVHREAVSPKPEPEPSSHAAASKRPPPPGPPEEEEEGSQRARDTVETPCKRAKYTHVMSTATIQQPWALDPYDPPISLLLSPSRARSSIGPTPQKDGRVLGLFDALSTGGDSGGRKTPSKKRRVALLPLAENVMQVATPSKREKRTATEQELLTSASKSEALLAVTTPSRNRAHQGQSPFSQRSLAKSGHDETPAFLRRRGQSARFAGRENGDGEDGDTWSPVAIRKLGPPAGRGLSALVKKLREMEDQYLDDEMDILRDLESCGDAPSQRVKPKDDEPAVLVGDSQAADMPLGPDRAVESEEDGDGDGNAAGKENRPPKFRKKKGQKRTTRKANIKPSTAKWKPEPKWEGGMESDEEGEEGPDDVVGETQVAQTCNVDPLPEDELAMNVDLDLSHDGSPKTKGGDRSKGGSQRQQQKGKKKSLQAEGVVKTTTTTTDPKESRTQKLKKKISATAHANFRALKIKNKNSKAKERGGGRFGKRR